MTLSHDQLLALRNLGSKAQGKAVPWINIREAQGLTDLGLARRNHSGWEITLEGACLLQNEPAAAAQVMAFPAALDLQAH